ncbi:DUF4389 domain-containing protein [Chloroflexota bacterium]
MAQTLTRYPMSLSIDYPDKPLNRLTTFFRIFMVIPILIILSLLSGSSGDQEREAGEVGSGSSQESEAGELSWQYSTWTGFFVKSDGNQENATGWDWQYSSAGIVVLPLVLMLLFRKKYPKWWFDWNLALTKFSNRVCAYMALLRDEYPSTDEEQAVHIEIPYPDAEQDLQRGMPLIKWFLSIPHYIVLCFLGIAAIVSIVIAWFVILFTGRYPQGLFDFVVGVMRWSLRVEVYAFLLTTDRYPPFSLSD